MKPYKLTEEMRTKLKRPIGELLEGTPDKTMRELLTIIEKEKPSRVIVVGDFVASNMTNYGLHIDTFIVDNKIMRKPIQPLGLNVERVIHTHNPAGTITTEAQRTVKKALHSTSPVALVVDGEDDLLVLPAVLSAPPKSFIIYGQPNVGIVLVRVTPDKKSEVKTIMESMAT